MAHGSNLTLLRPANSSSDSTSAPTANLIPGSWNDFVVGLTLFSESPSTVAFSSVGKAGSALHLLRLDDGEVKVISTEVNFRSVEDLLFVPEEDNALFVLDTKLAGIVRLKVARTEDDEVKVTEEKIVVQFSASDSKPRGLSFDRCSR